MFGIKFATASAERTMTVKLSIHQAFSYVAETAMWDRPRPGATLVVLECGNGSTLDRRCAG